ncbi:zona pellucida sperm-binding protein 3-like [Pseudophryne corroboree]|uniref:zona pellucida sperm-binding protein 3-like n=1 Tax=Pseudophryne corroboree TaxID=495146 RepID=UPI00308199F0
MGMCVRWSWLLLVALVYGSGLASAGERIFVRRQSDDWWRHHQSSSRGSARGSHVVAAQPVSGLGSPRWIAQPVSGLGSPRGGAQPVSGLGSSRWIAQPVSGLGSSRWGAQPVSGWGSPVRYDGGAAQSRQLAPPQNSPIRVQCGEDVMVVTVMRDLYGTGKLVKASDLSLGPQSCSPGTQSSDTSVVFEIGLQECGNAVQMTADWLIYTTSLTYTPTSPSGVPITRTNPAVVPIQCFYPRHGNVSSNAIKPTWVPFSTTVSSEERLSFSLQLMMDDWSAPRPSSDFQLGDMFYIEASVDTQNHVAMMLFVDSCVATLSPDVQSTPNYAIIAYNGCLVDGQQEDSSSAFISPRPEPDKLRFMVDAFRFTGIDVSLIYITCTLRAAAATRVPDPINKACSYVKTSSSWTAVDGSNTICQCCVTKNCAGTSRNLVSPLGRPRRIGKRAVADGSSTGEHGSVTLGPLLVVGAGHVQASRMTIESGHLEQWVLVAIVLVSLVVLLGFLVLTVKRIFKRHACGQAAEK